MWDRTVIFVLFGCSLFALSLWPLPATLAEETGAAHQEIENLDSQIQTLKGEILELNTLLFKLQEDLLFPEDSSVTVFLSIEGGNYFTLDSVKLSLDEKMVSSYLYTDRETLALKKGGVQRLYMGNIKSGDHQLVAVFTGKGPQEKDYKRAETIPVQKDKGATFIKLIIRDNLEKKQPDFVYETWN
jgi:hypothetical protein